MKKYGKIFSMIMFVALMTINSHKVLGAEGEHLGTWEAKASMPTARYDIGVAEVDGKIYAIGGIRSDYLNSVEEYDPQITTIETPTAPM